MIGRLAPSGLTAAVALLLAIAILAPPTTDAQATAAPAGASGSAVAAPAPAASLAPPTTAPRTSAVEVKLSGDAAAGQWGPALNIILMLTLMSLAPAILVSVTSFTRILISLHFLRQAIGTQTAPGNQVLVGLALFLTFFVMQPVALQIHQDALGPLLNGEVDGPAAVETAWPPLKQFMLPQTRSKDIHLFQELAQLDTPETPEDIPPRVLIPAFLISEIKTAFQIGILLYLPFLMLDMIVASVLLSLGMMMLPPVVISTPLKLMLFVIVDGWNLVIGSLVRSVIL